MNLGKPLNRESKLLQPKSTLLSSQVLRHTNCVTQWGEKSPWLRVRPKIKPKVQELVLEGISDPLEVQRHLKHYLCHSLCSKQPPDRLDRAYYPDQQGIRNHINKAKRSIQLSVLDQENVALKFSSGKKSHLQQGMRLDHSTQTKVTIQGLKIQSKACSGFTRRCGNRTCSCDMVTRLP